MRQRLDCAVFNGAEQATDIGRWLGMHSSGRLHLHYLNGRSAGVAPQSVELFTALAQQLCSYDACIVFVNQKNLAWARTALSAAQGLLDTPVMVIAKKLTAPALSDLYLAGVADFVRDPLCLEELRMRLERVLSPLHYDEAALKASKQVAEGVGTYGQLPSATTLMSTQDFCSNILNRSGNEIDAFAIASATRSATSKESFRMAKGKLIAHFEKAYIMAALGKHAGNIAMAARAAQKHRRAFWALMRKHEIDAKPFRSAYCPKANQDG